MTRSFCWLGLVCVAAGCSERAEGRARAAAIPAVDPAACTCEPGGDVCGYYSCCGVEVPACETVLASCAAVLPGSERRHERPFETVAVYEHAVEVIPEVINGVGGLVAALPWFACNGDQQCTARVEGHGGRLRTTLRTSTMIAADPAPPQTCSCVAKYKVDAQMLKYSSRLPIACRDGDQCRPANVWRGCLPEQGGQEANGCCYDEFTALSDLVDHEQTRECVLAETRASCPRGERAWACGEDVVCAAEPAQACDLVCGGDAPPAADQESARKR